MQEDLEALLKKIESLFVEYSFGWENVLYIHLYIADMNGFTTANDTYVRYITQEKCPFGVPSRSTVELPLLQVGLGSAYIEVLVANDHTKRVLHVQSISSWAPSCIGPYSQVKYIFSASCSSANTEFYIGSVIHFWHLCQYFLFFLFLQNSIFDDTKFHLF